MFSRQLPPAGQAGHVPPQSSPVSPSSKIWLLQCTEGEPTSWNVKLGTEHDAAISASTSRARGNQCFGGVVGEGCKGPKRLIRCALLQTRRTRGGTVVITSQYVSSRATGETGFAIGHRLAANGPRVREARGVQKCALHRRSLTGAYTAAAARTSARDSVTVAPLSEIDLLRWARPTSPA